MPKPVLILQWLILHTKTGEIIILVIIFCFIYKIRPPPKPVLIL